MVDLENEKKAAARRSMDFISDGMVVGLGTGSTAAYAVRMLGERVSAGLNISAIPTSAQTRRLAEEAGIPLISLETTSRIDVTIDGADELTSGLNAIKGGGGALLHEKIVAAASTRVVIIADSSKVVDELGRGPLPIEVVPFAWPLVARELAALGARPGMRLTTAGRSFETDEGNYILDTRFDRIADANKLAVQLDSFTGIVEHGLFVDLIDLAIIARGDDIEIIQRPGLLT